MQSDRNSFCSNVVLDIVNMALWDEDNIFYQIYEKEIYQKFNYDDFDLRDTKNFIFQQFCKSS